MYQNRGELRKINETCAREATNEVVIAEAGRVTHLFSVNFVAASLTRRGENGCQRHDDVRGKQGYTVNSSLSRNSSSSLRRD